MAKPTHVISVEGVEECLKAFSGLEKEIRKNANGELRKASREIAAQVPSMIGGSGAPQEKAIIAAARPRSDRYVVVAVPGVVPDLSGLKRQSGTRAPRSLDPEVQKARRAAARSARKSKMSIGWALEKGSKKKQFHGPPLGGLVGRNRAKIFDFAGPKYMAELERIAQKFGLR